MKQSQTAAVLTWVSSVDGRLVNEMTVDAWHQIIGHYPVEDVQRAVREQKTVEARHIYPADVIKLLDADPNLGVLPSATVEMLEEQRAEWCAEHGVTVEEFEVNKHDFEWVTAVANRG